VRSETNQLFFWSIDEEVAVKFIFKEKVPVHSLCKDPELGVVPMEVYVLKNLRHPNIVGYIDFFVVRISFAV
jgi:serine/threonine protein kinase